MTRHKFKRIWRFARGLKKKNDEEQPPSDRGGLLPEADGDGSAYRHFRTSFNAKEYAKIAQVNSERPSGAKIPQNAYIFLSFFQNTHVLTIKGVRCVLKW